MYFTYFGLYSNQQGGRKHATASTNNKQAQSLDDATSKDHYSQYGSIPSGFKYFKSVVRDLQPVAGKLQITSRKLIENSQYAHCIMEQQEKLVADYIRRRRRLAPPPSPRGGGGGSAANKKEKSTVRRNLDKFSAELDRIYADDNRTCRESYNYVDVKIQKMDADLRAKRSIYEELAKESRAEILLPFDYIHGAVNSKNSAGGGGGGGGGHGHKKGAHKRKKAGAHGTASKKHPLPSMQFNQQFVINPHATIITAAAAAAHHQSMMLMNHQAIFHVSGASHPLGGAGGGGKGGNLLLTQAAAVAAAAAAANRLDPAMVKDMPIDPHEPLYCYCKQVSFGDMIACDNPDCQTEWYHFACVGIARKPTGKWFCPTCIEQMQRSKQSMLLGASSEDTKTE